MKNEKNMSVQVASKELGIHPQTLRRWIRQGTCPFASHISPDSNGKESYYYINWNRLKTYLSAEDMRVGCPLSAN